MAKTNWHREPIVVLPVAVAAVALILAPFVASADRAVQFYATLGAAVIAAGAVVLNSHYQARLVDSRAKVDRQRLDAERALYLYGFIETLKQAFKRAAATWGRVTYNVAPGMNPSPDDLSVVPAGQFIKAITLETEQNLQNALSLAASLPHDIAAEVTIAFFAT